MATMTPNFPVSFDLPGTKQVVNIVDTILRSAGYTNLAHHKQNNMSHYMIVGISPEPPNNTKEELFYVKWEKALFHKAGSYIEGLKGTRGACSMNIDAVEKTLQFSNCKILFASGEDRMIYEIDAKTFMDKSYERPQLSTPEVTRCIGVESLKPWDLALKHGASIMREQQQQQQQQTQQLQPQELQGGKGRGGGGETILLLRCSDCQYMRIQTKQDTQAIELKMLRDGHSQTFRHKMEIVKVSRTDPLALKLRDSLQRWEKW
jgi:hypothetical protein